MRGARSLALLSLAGLGLAKPVPQSILDPLSRLLVDADPDVDTPIGDGLVPVERGVLDGAAENHAGFVSEMVDDIPYLSENGKAFRSPIRHTEPSVRYYLGVSTADNGD
ncbi:hypothetical protein N658DRAFT_501900 [Parathielavia hyrcaniae]|uniref:Uncharacterized protein n=1 Tax=Parathielavia hyrcaniae TaxID=113614 RepID=A0AAN6PQL7_9PEZI|nr:hypothetical protein N658DRAFT_501900 [Parathielavia hyrcaniae]